MQFTAWPGSAMNGSRRHCSRPTCSDVAVVTLTYEYRRSQVWLDHLAAERDPHAYDLCRRHADELSVPLGWHLSDRRVAVPAITADLLAG
jgi:hypothetical protein